MIGHLETNPITKKPETASHLAEQFSWVPLPYSSPPGCPFPVKSLALSAHVSSDNSFPSVRQESALGALEGRPPFRAPGAGSRLTRGKELSEETRADKARNFTGKGHPGGEQ